MKKNFKKMKKEFVIGIIIAFIILTLIPFSYSKLKNKEKAILELALVDDLDVVPVIPPVEDDFDDFEDFDLEEFKIIKEKTSVPLVASLSYDKTSLTNEDVTVTVSFNRDDAVVTNNNGSLTYTFKKNGEFTFYYKDIIGKTGEITAKVNNIDKTVPTAELEYEKSTEKVVVRVVNPSEEITFKNGMGVYEFYKNGNYEIIFYDKAGNAGKLIAIVNDITNINKNRSISDDDSNNGIAIQSEDNYPVESNDNNNSNLVKSVENENNNSVGFDNSTANNLIKSNENNNSNNNEIEPLNVGYKKYTDKDVSVEIPEEVKDNNLTLKVVPFDLTDSLKNKFGKYSEFYDIYLQNAAAERVNITVENPIKISIKLNNTKELVGVFEVTNDNTFKPINYTKNGDNVELTTNSLGKYVISYEEHQETVSKFAKNVVPNVPAGNEKQTNNLLWTVIFVMSLALIGTICYYGIKKVNE